MSGGAYDYAYLKVHRFINCLEQGVDEDDVPTEASERRERFALHLKRVAEAMRMIEWHDSGDVSREDEDRAIDAVLYPDGA